MSTILVLQRATLLLGLVLALSGSVARAQPSLQAATQSTTQRARVETALRARLRRKYLSYHWVVCVQTDRSYKGARIWRCNVDFGDPHIVQYCVILSGTTLITNYENPALTCGRPKG